MKSVALVCLALNLYHEARGEGPEGMFAVGTVTMNRVAHPDWPDDVCGVVFQPHQFSWTLQGTPPITEPEAFAHAYAIAGEVLAGAEAGVLDHTALFYHETSVSPGWRLSLHPIGQIGRHMFYAQEKSDAENERGPVPLARAIRPVARPDAG